MVAIRTGFPLNLPPHPKPEHEALADLDRIAVGGADARLVVDAGRDEARAALGKRGIDQLVEIVLVAGPGAFAQARRAGERYIVGRPGGRGASAWRFRISGVNTLSGT